MSDDGVTLAEHGWRLQLSAITRNLDEGSCGRCGGPIDITNEADRRRAGVSAVRDLDRLSMSVVHFQELARGLGRDVPESWGELLDEIEYKKLEIGRTIFGLDPASMP